MKKIVSLVIVSAIPLFMNAQEIGLQLYSLRNQFENDVHGTLDIIKSWGITKVEGGGSSYGLSEEEFKKAMTQRGIDVVSTAATFEELRDTPDSVVQRAKGYTADYVVCFWIPHEEGVFAMEETKKALTVFNRTGKMLKNEGVSLVYHPHGYEFREHEDGTFMDYMIKNAEHFDFEMDVFWVKHANVEPLELLKKYPKKFKLMHLKDRAQGTKGNMDGRADVESNVVLGNGDVGISEIVR